MHRKVGWAFSLGIMALASAPLLAAAADAIHGRIDRLHDLGVVSKNVRDELNKDSPNLMILQISAREIGNAAQGMPSWFPQGSGPQPGVKTRAKPEILTRPGEFKKVQDAFIAQVAVFVKAAASGNFEAMRTEHGKLARTCTNCHDAFRNE